MYIRSSKNSGRRNRRIVAEEEIQNNGGGGEGEVTVDPEATELVFEAQDVAELVAEVTGEDVEVEADEDAVTFTIGDTDYTVEAEGQEEILETSRKVLRGKTSVRANRTVTRRPVAASSRANQRRATRTVRRVQR